MKALVTGGLGFIGCNLANRLLHDGHAVAVFDNASRGRWKNCLSHGCSVRQHTQRTLGSAVLPAANRMESAERACATPAPKSNSTILAIDAALEDVKSGRTLAVPEHLRDAHYAGAKRLGHGEGYKYAHDYPEHFVAQDYLGAAKRYYEPTDQGVEKKIKERVEKWRSLRTKG